MKSLLLLVGGLFFVFVFFNGTEKAMTQTPRIDTIRFMAATRGNDYDGDGYLEWCVSSKGWHAGWRIVPGGPYGPPNAIDELAQRGPDITKCTSDPTDPKTGGRVEPVDLWTYGFTNAMNCTLSSPCSSLYVSIRSRETTGQCKIIDARLYDYNTVSFDPTLRGDYRGKQRFLHASGPGGSSVIQVASNGWHFNSAQVGTIVDDHLCTTDSDPPLPGWSGYHVHHDYWPSTVSMDCLWNWNGNLIGANTVDWEKQNLAHWVHLVEHKSGAACINPGAKSADFLLRIGGELDGPMPNSGQGARSLTTGATITTSSTCIDETSWCGTMTVTPPLLRAAKSYDQGWPPGVYLKGQQQSLPPKGVNRYWYGPDAQGYQFWVKFDDVLPRNTQISCSGTVYAGERMYYLNFVSSANITCPNGQNWDGAGNPTTYRVVTRHVNYIWSQFRGINGINPSQPPTQEEANAWAQSWIDTGHWLNVVKPAIDAVIRAASRPMDMATLGITGSPPFDNDIDDDGVVDAMGEPNNLALEITEPRAPIWPSDGMRRDWILTARPRWKLDKPGFE